MARHDELLPHLESFLKNTGYAGHHLLLGLSGGLDSCVLLDLLHGLQATAGFRLHALHVNHGISPNADAWERFCAELCASHAIPFRAARVNVPRDSGLGLEAAARAARYAALLAQPVDAVVLAHHRDDQAETLLLQLLRGAGVKGLAAMPPVARAASPVPPLPNPLPRGERGACGIPAMPPVLLRPLLDVSRAELEAYAKARGLLWIEDESNLDLAYDRNFLRHHIFPELEKRFPASRATLARSAAHLAEADALLREVAGADAGRLVRDGRLEVAGLAAMSEARAKNLLRYWLDSQGATASSRRLQEAYRQLLAAGPEARISIKLDGGTLYRYRGLACFESAGGAGVVPELRWRGEPALAMPGGRLVFTRVAGQGLSLAKAQAGELWVRARQGGERFRPDCRRPNRTLKALFQQSAIPSWQRAGLPLVYLDGALAVVPGVGVACGLRAAPDEDGLLIEWRPG